MKLLHDLKSPLTALRVLRARLRLNDAEAGLLGATLAQIENLLSSCVGERSQGEPGLTHQDLKELCEQVVCEKRLLTGGPVLLVWQADGEFSLNLDRLEMYRLLSNLMHNAVQAVRGSSAEIRLEVRLAGTRLFLQVIDSGPGIHAVAKKEEPRGWGIGLIIVREIVASHDGTMDLAANPGGGTYIRLKFPLAVT